MPIVSQNGMLLMPSRRTGSVEVGKNPTLVAKQNSPMVKWYHITVTW